MIPSLELTLATSMVPVSGAIFVVRALMEGRFTDACIYLPIVVSVTAICCLLSIRWAVRQFESESVMFAESERWNFQSWMRQVWRDRGIVASPSEAMLCGLIILVAMFFSQFVAAPTSLKLGSIGAARSGDADRSDTDALPLDVDLPDAFDPSIAKTAQRASGPGSGSYGAGHRTASHLFAVGRSHLQYNSDWIGDPARATECIAFDQRATLVGSSTGPGVLACGCAKS